MTGRMGWRWLVGATITAVVGVILTAPVGICGVCPSSEGDCQIWRTNFFMIPVPDWLWAVVAFAAFLVVLAIGWAKNRPHPD